MLAGILKQHFNTTFNTTFWYNIPIQHYNTNCRYTILIQNVDTPFWYNIVIQNVDTTFWNNIVIQHYDTTFWTNIVIQYSDTTLSCNSLIKTDANNSNKHYSRKLFYMYMWSGCELIDTKNISLPNQKMKYQSYSHSDDIFIILKSTINTDTSIFVFSREKIFKIRFPKTVVDK